LHAVPAQKIVDLRFAPDQTARPSNARHGCESQNATSRGVGNSGKPRATSRGTEIWPDEEAAPKSAQAAKGQAIGKSAGTAIYGCNFCKIRAIARVIVAKLKKFQGKRSKSVADLTFSP
jgi:hypothetical protein